MPTYDKNFRINKQGAVWVNAELIDQILEWITKLDFASGEGAVSVNASGILLSLANGVYPIQLTADINTAGYYTGSAYCNGTDAAATHTGQDIKMPFDIDITDPQGYYYAIRSGGAGGNLSSDAVWIVVGGLPLPPATGSAYLKSTYRVLTWVEPETCA
jgi:hypothetical protein